MISSIRTSLIAVPFVLLAGCAGDGRVTQDKAEAANCVREYRIGSNIPVVNCSGPQTEAERQQMIEQTKNSVRSVPAKTQGGGTGS